MKTHFIIKCFQQRYTYPYYDRKTFALKQLYVFTLHDCLSEKSLQGWMEKLDVFWMLFIKTFSTYSRSQNFLLLNIFNLTTMIWTELYWIPCLSCKRFKKYWSLERIRNGFWYSQFSNIKIHHVQEGIICDISFESWLVEVTLLSSTWQIRANLSKGTDLSLTNRSIQCRNVSIMASVGRG